MLRIAFASAFYFNPALVIGTYLALGLVVAAARHAFPDRAATPAAAEQVANDEAEMRLAA